MSPNPKPTFETVLAQLQADDKVSGDHQTQVRAAFRRLEAAAAANDRDMVQKQAESLSPAARIHLFAFWAVAVASHAPASAEPPSEPGIYDIPFDVYVRIKAINASSLKHILPPFDTHGYPGSPRHYQHRRQNPSPETPAKRKGRATHTLSI